MDMQLITILVAVGVVVLGTFILKKTLSFLLRLGGLGVISFLARANQQGQEGFTWMDTDDFIVIGSAAAFGFAVALVLNSLIFREDGLGRHFGVPIIAAAITYGAALLIEIP